MKFTGAKSRLAGILSGQERRELTLLLLSGVLGAIRLAGLIGVTRVVSSDRDALGLAVRAGATAVEEPGDEGVNAAVLRGVAHSGSPDAVLVLPSDLPLVRGSEITRLLSMRSKGLDAVIVPSASFDGTNALLFPARRSLPLSYDRDSFWNHLAACARKGLSLGVSSEPGLMFDVDSPEDFRRLARARSDRPAAAFARRAERRADC